MFGDFILPAFSLALSATALPGPLQAYIISVALRHGWRKGLVVVVSPLLTDIPIIVVTLLMLEQLAAYVPQIIPVIRLAGGVFLLWLAWGAWKQYRAGVGMSARDGQPADDTGGVTRLHILTTGILMNYLSPGPYLFWTTVNGPLLMKALVVSQWHAVAFLLSFYGVFLLGLGAIFITFDRLGRMNERVTRGLTLVTLVLILWFGTELIFEAFGWIALHRWLSGLALLLGLMLAGWRWLRGL